MAQLDARSSGRMGMRALVYYLSTTVLAAIVGIIMVMLIHPGDPLIKTHVESKPDDTKVSTLDAILDIIRCAFSYQSLATNIVSCLQSSTAMRNCEKNIQIMQSILN